MKNLTKEVMKETGNALTKLVPTSVYGATLGSCIQYLIDNGLNLNYGSLAPVVLTSGSSLAVLGVIGIKKAWNFYEERKQPNPVVEYAVNKVISERKLEY